MHNRAWVLVKAVGRSMLLANLEGDRVRKPIPIADEFSSTR